MEVGKLYNANLLWGEDTFTYTVVFSLLSLMGFVIIHHLIKRRLIEIRSVMFPWKLRKLPFVHSFYVGKGEHMMTNNERIIFSDATYTVVVKNGERAIGIISFELSKSTLTVYQLQGLKGVNLRGLDIGDLLLSCAEIVALRLGRVYVRVQPAYLHTYFELDEEHSLYPQLYKHQARLNNMYNASSKKRGYEYCGFGFCFWYQKVLRKKITFSRFLRLQVLLFDRHAAWVTKGYGGKDLLQNE